MVKRIYAKVNITFDNGEKSRVNVAQNAHTDGLRLNDFLEHKGENFVVQGVGFRPASPDSTAKTINYERTVYCVAPDPDSRQVCHYEPQTYRIEDGRLVQH